MKRKFLLVLLVLTLVLTLCACAEAHTHHYEQTVVQPSCTEQGYTTYTCSCGDSYIDSYVATTDHTPLSAVEENRVEAQCEVAGSYELVVYCEVCNEELSREHKIIAALGHDLVHHNGQSATCTEKGWQSYDTCSRCSYTTYVEIPATGHNYEFNRIEWTEYTAKAIYVCKNNSSHIEEHVCTITSAITTVATCQSTGIRTYTATYDGHTSTKEEVLAIDSSNHTNLQHHDAQAPTCTTIGWEAYDACTCGYTTYVELPQLGHDVVHHNGQSATCTEKGWQPYDTCSRCDYTTYVEIPAIGHNYDFNRIEWTGYTAKAVYVCTNNGSHIEEHVCTITSAVTTVATCQSTGIRTYTATYDGHTSTKEEVLAIDSSNHTNLQHHDAQAPTCTTIGWEAYDACTCGYTTYVEIPAIGHNYVDDVCTRCHDTRPLQGTEIHLATLNLTNDTVYGKVSNTTTVFSFIKEVSVAEGATWYLSTDIYGISTIPTKTIPLSVGDNSCYILVINGDDMALYNVTIRRRPMHNVTFNANGGTTVASQTVEEDNFATEPISPTRAGYTFDSWDYDFSEPIIQNTTISANWIANTDTPYKVEYYLQNLDDDNYTLTATDNLTGTTDTTAIAEQKVFEHFTFYSGKSTTSGNINSNGSLVLKVYYTRDKYSVSNSNTSHGDISQNGSYKYETSVTATPYIGCQFDGWYNNDILVSKNNTIALTQNVTAKFSPKPEMLPFNFNATGSSCTITGIKDKTVTEIVVPDYVTSIGSSAFSGCSRLTSITLPFVGAKAGVTSSSTYQYPLGYIFGTSSYTGGTGVEQYYYGSSTSSTTSKYYYIPSSLKSVTITGGYIPYGAFYNCSMLTDITLGDSVTSIGSSAFEYCSRLASVTIGNSVTSIGGEAFDNCSSLTSVTIGNSVTSIGGSAFDYCSKLTKVNYTSDINSWAQIEFGNSVANPLYYAHNLYINDKLVTEANITTATTISAYAFYNCSSLTSITIGDSVTSIGSSAFAHCSSLQHNEYDNALYLGNSNNPYMVLVKAKSTSITNCSINDNCKIILSSAFSGCSSLESITLPFVGYRAGVTSSSTYQYPLGYIFGTSSYTGGRKVTQYYYGSSTSSTTSSTYYIPTSLKSVTITGGYIPYGAFYNCSMLTDITLGDSVTSIGSYAFENCSSLTSVTIGNSVTSIGSGAFRGCSSLQSITLPFVGAKAGVRSTDTYQYPFGYIFGTSSYTGGTEVKQYYYGSSTSSTTYNYYYIPTSLKSVTITGGYIPYGAFYNCSSLTSVTIGNSVTSIGGEAFDNCSSLTSVTIGNSVTSIGGSAFDYCSKLTKVNYTGDINSWAQIEFGNSVANPLYYAHNLYINDKLVTEANITTATKISAYAFRDCSSLTSVTVGDSVTSIGEYAFSGCSSLTSITIPDSVTSIGSYAFCNCSSLTSITIPDSVTSIGEYAFYNCSSLTSITIPDSVTSIGEYAFYGCYKLVEVINHSQLNITKGDSSNGYVGYYALEVKTSGPSSIVNKDGYLFYTCDSTNYLLGYVGTDTELTLPVGYNGQSYEIYEYAFYGCSSLTSITIPDSVTSIGSSAFNGCSSLESITLPFVGAKAGVTSSSTYQYPLGYIFGTSSYTGGTGVEQYYYGSSTSSRTHDYYYIPTSLKSVTITGGYISYGAFNNCRMLTDITLGDSVTSIGEYAFEYCSRLASVTIGNSVTSIGDWAFAYCSSLTSITIGDSVTSIGYYAFEYCSSLQHNEYDNALYLGNSNNPYMVLVKAKSTSITNCSINDNCKIILSYAFKYCRSLTSIIISDSVTSIDSSAFYYCSSLTSITVGSGNTTYHSKDNCLIETATNKLVLGCKNSIISNYVTSIGEYAFRGCSSLTSITIPDSVTSIGFDAFYKCSSLTSVTIGNSVTSIGSYAFENCSSLTSVTIGNSVTSIGFDAFRGCSSLTSVTFENPNGWWRSSSSTATSGTSISSSSLANTSSAAAYLTSTYRDYYWKRTEN